VEKPDVLWERPNLERFYGRLEDEYELKERANVLTRKLTVISDTAQALADIIDTERSLRLEMIIVLLIAVEIVISVYPGEEIAADRSCPLQPKIGSARYSRFHSFLKIFQATGSGGNALTRREGVTRGLNERCENVPPVCSGLPPDGSDDEFKEGQRRAPQDGSRVGGACR